MVPRSLSIVRRASLNGSAIVADSTSGGAVLMFTVTNSSALITAVKYGHAGFVYSCAKFRVFAIAPNLLNVTCKLSPGAGRDLPIRVTFCAASNGSQSCAELVSAETFSFPLPTIAPNSLRLASSSPGSGSNALTMPSSFPDTIAFAGSEFVNSSSAMQVFFGPRENPRQFTCALKTALTTPTEVIHRVCRLLLFTRH